jgi:hypothetical protein
MRLRWLVDSGAMPGWPDMPSPGLPATADIVSPSPTTCAALFDGESDGAGPALLVGGRSDVQCLMRSTALSKLLANAVSAPALNCRGRDAHLM